MDEIIAPENVPVDPNLDDVVSILSESRIPDYVPISEDSLLCYYVEFLIDNEIKMGTYFDRQRMVLFIRSHHPDAEKKEINKARKLVNDETGKNVLQCEGPNIRPWYRLPSTTEEQEQFKNICAEIYKIQNNNETVTNNNQKIKPKIAYTSAKHDLWFEDPFTNRLEAQWDMPYSRAQAYGEISVAFVPRGHVPLCGCDISYENTIYSTDEFCAAYNFAIQHNGKPVMYSVRMDVLRPFLDFISLGLNPLPVMPPPDKAHRTR